MKKIYLTLSLACLALLGNAQVYETSFETTLLNSNLDKSVFSVATTGSNLVISSLGHDEYQAPKYYFHNELGRTTIAMSAMDTIFVRAKAEFKDPIPAPLVRFTVFDDAGVQPGNNELRAVNSLSLTSDWQVLKYVVPNWYDGDVSNSTLDTNKIAGMSISINGGFGSFPTVNAFNDSINAPFVGTIYMDYISIGGSTPMSGFELATTTSFAEGFSSDVSDKLWSSNSLTTTISEDNLSIVTAGHDEYDYVRYVLSDLVDLSTNAALEFTATAIPADGYTGNLGVKLVPVDHAGNRLEGSASFQSLSSISKTIQVLYTNFTDPATNRPVNKEKIAFVDIYINRGFSTAPTTNENDDQLNTAFEGEIKIDQIRLGEGISVNSVSKDKSKTALSLYPNPTSNSITVQENAKGGTYQLYNTAGVLMTEGLIESTRVDVSNLETGLYFIQVTNNENVFTSSFVKQ